nr:polygalacturonase At1g48100-like [Ipomoea batatas]
MEFTSSRFLVLVLLISFVNGGLFGYSHGDIIISQISQPPFSAPAPAPAPQSAAIFNVMSYGGVGDGVADDTLAFKRAWDEACQSDLTPILVNGMSMQGGGLIDGRGEKWWNLPCKPHRGVNGTTLPGPCDSPVAIRFFTSSNLTVQDLKMKNSPLFHFRFDNCHDVHIDSLYIKAPPNSPNTDGIHIENTYDVTIHNSIVSNGDDCISIGAGCYNVDIRNMTCGPSHGISIGSLGIKHSRACVSNIKVRDSTIRNSDNGVRIKTWQGGFGAVSKVTFDNIRMDNVRNPIIVDQYYCSNKACTNQTSAVYISDVLYSNIKGTFDARSPPMRLACSDSVPCTNLTLSEVELYPSQGHRILDPFCWNAFGELKTVTIPPVFCLLEGNPQVRFSCRQCFPCGCAVTLH